MTALKRERRLSAVMDKGRVAFGAGRPPEAIGRRRPVLADARDDFKADEPLPAIQAHVADLERRVRRQLATAAKNGGARRRAGAPPFFLTQGVRKGVFARDLRPILQGLTGAS